MKNCGVHKGSPARGAGSAQPRLRGCRRFVSAVCLRRPYLFSRKRKDRGEKSAWGRGVHAASDFGQVPMFSSVVPLGGHSTSFCYAPPDTGVLDLQLVALERLPSIEGADRICWSAPFCGEGCFVCPAPTKGSAPQWLPLIREGFFAVA